MKPAPVRHFSPIIELDVTIPGQPGSLRNPYYNHATIRRNDQNLGCGGRAPAATPPLAIPGKSGVALRVPPQSKSGCGTSRVRSVRVDPRLEYRPHGCYGTSLFHIHQFNLGIDYHFGFLCGMFVTPCRQAAVILALSIGLFGVRADVRVQVDHISLDDLDPGFRFADVPPPSQNDAATAATFEIIDGQADRNSGDLSTLHDGRVPSGPDDPEDNFFFAAGTDGGRLLVDLGTVLSLKQINTYSLHPGTRGPQVFRLFASDGAEPTFNPHSQRGINPESCGWKRIASVDTRPKGGEPGGQYGVSICDSSGSLGRFRYLLFDISRTEDTDPFGNTFFSEIDVVDMTTPPEVIAAAKVPRPERIRTEFEAAGGKYHITIDTTAAPDLTGWTTRVLAPVIQTWYPKIVDLLPGAGFTAPDRLRIAFRAGINVPAYANNNGITCSADWFRKNLAGEAAGSVVHEMVHVVQHYGRVRNGRRVPGWLVEGIPDYIRWYLYEPQSKGAEIPAKYASRVRYDASYRFTANFLNWVVQKYNRDLVWKINSAARDGRYQEQLWKELTGKTVQELGAEWKSSLEKPEIPATAGSRP